MNELVPVRKKSGGPRPPGATPASRVAILLEEIEGKFHLTMEAVVSTRRKIDDLRTELSGRMDILELAVRQNSLDIRKNTEDIQQLRTDVQQNSDDIRKIRADVCKNGEEIRTMREHLETRIEVVERRLGTQ